LQLAGAGARGCRFLVAGRVDDKKECFRTLADVDIPPQLQRMVRARPPARLGDSAARILEVHQPSSRAAPEPGVAEMQAQAFLAALAALNVQYEAPLLQGCCVCANPGSTMLSHPTCSKRSTRSVRKECRLCPKRTFECVRGAVQDARTAQPPARMRWRAQGLFQGIPESAFRADVSSTELRKQQQGAG
jgi:hypothetical protein